MKSDNSLEVKDAKVPLPRVLCILVIHVLKKCFRCTALELAPKQVRVNAVNPGVVLTELQKRGGMNQQQYEAFLKRSEETHALGTILLIK